MKFYIKFVVVLVLCFAAVPVLSVVAPAQLETGGLIISVIGSLAILYLIARRQS